MLLKALGHLIPKCQLLKPFGFMVLTCSAFSNEAPQHPPKDLWNASDYAVNSKVQETHFDRFFDYNSLFGCNKVLDVGCGDGKLTAKIAKYLKEGQVTGIDISKGMIEHALSEHPSDKFPNLKFQEQSAQTFQFDDQFDYIISIHTLHWIKEQKEALKNIYNHLASEGKVFFLFAPTKEGLPFDLALKDTVKSWNEELGNFKTNQFFFDIETYRKLLTEAGFHVDGIHYIYTETLHDNKTSLSNWLKQWLPHYKALPIDTKDTFITELTNNYLDKAKLQRTNGPITWGEYVIIVKASK